MALFISRLKTRSVTNPSLIHLFFSSSSSPPNDQSSPQNSSISQPDSLPSPSFSSSYFSDVKSSLKQQPKNPQFQTQFNKPIFPPEQNSSSKPSTIRSLEEIRKNLAEFRRRSSPPPLPSSDGSPARPSQQQQISFQELYKRRVIGKTEDGYGANIETNNNNKPFLDFDKIRESLKHMKPNASTSTGRRGQDKGPFSSLKLGPSDGEDNTVESSVIDTTWGRGFGGLGKQERIAKEPGSSTEFVKMYSYGELGEKLRSLRPEVKEGEKGWFSLRELNERLKKLRELEEKETESRVSAFSFKDLREGLVKLKKNDDEEKAKRSSIYRLNIFGQMGATQMDPPKEHLVEQYFHPDNMSSAEKLKIELANVREEFKMSESDCGSARVQVAQLTTKIKHLSSVLHKKDKHSRKGLQEMVQRRKKLLKYLRRTDWDSYCFVLSKLGLRDNPDFKN